MRHEGFAGKLTAVLSALTLCFAIVPAASAAEPASAQNDITSPTISEQSKTSDTKDSNSHAPAQDSATNSSKQTETGNTEHSLTPSSEQPPVQTEQPAPSKPKPVPLDSVGSQDGTCTSPGEHRWPDTPGAVNPLTWKEETVGSDCVLTLESGIIPAHTGSDTDTTIPWTGHSVTKLKINAEVSLASTGGRYLFSMMPDLKTADVQGLNTTGSTDMFDMFWDCPNLTEIDGLENWDTSSVTDMRSMFNGIKVTRLELSAWNTSSLNAAVGMFAYNPSLKTIGNPGLNFPANANITNRFLGDTGLICGEHTGQYHWGDGTNTLTWHEAPNAELTECNLTLDSGTVPDHTGTNEATLVPWTGDNIVSATVTEGVRLTPTGGRYLFGKTPSLKTANVAGLKTDNAKDLYAMFWTDTNLNSIDGLDQWNTGGITSTRAMFNSTALTELNLSSWDTHSINDMHDMFWHSASLKTLGNPGLDIPDSVDYTTNEMFTGATSLPCGVKTGRHRWTGNGNTLKWNEHTDDNDDTMCVLTLESGIVPNHNGTDLDPATPWYNDTNVKKATVNPTVKLASAGGEYLFYKMTALESADVANLDTSDATNIHAIFSGDSKLTRIDGLDQWHSGKVTTMRSAFQECGLLTNLDISNWNTSQVIDMGYMFYKTNSLNNLNLDSWDTSRVTDMDKMFYNDANVKTIGNPGLNIPDNIDYTTNDMYTGSGLPCKAKTGRHRWANGINTLKWNEHTDDNDDTMCVLTLESGTVPNHNGTDLDPATPWHDDDNVKKATVNPTVKLASEGGDYLFYKMPSLESAYVGNLDTSDATNIHAMFDTDPKLTKIDGLNQWHTGKVTTMRSTFQESGLLTNLDDISNWDTSHVTDMGHMFYKTNSLNNLDLQGWDTTNVSIAENMLPPNLKALRLGTKTKLISGAFTNVAPPAPGIWTDRSGLTNPAWTGNTTALADRAAGTNSTGTYILDGQVNPFPTPVSALPFTGNDWWTMAKRLMLLVASGIALSIVAYVRSRQWNRSRKGFGR
ncbi:BspA family leucine-rich repeat surface protein [Bifidobacterium sp. ESL0732]|uniref:BspA family leucine-rich repeat surface protein n=1 Tax=Bifidobacterium sp. ESL0732 TaxID=2983222 RepID=UPI0023F8E17D|nr:BspA family leucine-rich repeat surface protein [Bifidobacterium sp. ESL0732]WEV63712.1 BspA family leucine-rich repeat surface protein [Bifidobacterium sp. ESL0732]